MTRHKSFGSANPYAEVENVTFDLYDETFTCKKAVQGASLLRFGKDVQDNPNEAVMNFFKVVMLPDDYERFADLIESEDKIVDAALLGEIAGYLVGEYSARPTEPSSSSKSGRESTGPTSGRKR